mmetsp:Transcript_18988/g.44264  ORF Transcript_18988/g.44264 Transcript_18988/m.44264 type:complete len:1820 (-) Transcript_18988:53-5512(-)
MSVGFGRAFLLLIHCSLHAFASATQLSVGGSGWALRFDGTDDLVAMYSEMPAPPLTLEMWVMPMELLDGSGNKVVRFRDVGVLLSQASFESARNLFSILYNGNQVWHQDTTVSNIETPDGTSLGAAVGLLYHYAYVRDGNNVSIFVDGELVQEGILNSADDLPIPDPLPWLLGARWSLRGGAFATDDRNFGGIIDEVRWWRVARSPEELRRYSRLSVPDEHPGLARQWRFDDGEGVGGDTFSLGGSDPSRAPVWVPSVVGGSGGPIAITTTEGAPAQPVELCAVLLPPRPGAVVSVTFLDDASLGILENARPAVLDMREVDPPQWVDGQRYCATTRFTPVRAGREELKFEVTALLPTDLPSGEQVSGSQILVISVAPNQPPSAGVAKAVYTNGVDSYVSLGSWDLAERFSWAYWINPVAVQDNVFHINRHLGSGKNIFVFGFQAGKYMLRIDCRAGCMNPDGSTPIVRWFVPEGSGTDLVLDSGWTVGEVQDMRSQLQHLGGTFECHFRGNSTSPPRATVTIYLNGRAIGHSDDLPACVTTPTNEEAYDSWENRPTPWELGQEYDSAEEVGEHLPGLLVRPSDHTNAVFDQVVFWNRSLSATEMLDVSRGNLPEDQIIHYNFDLDDPAVCAERQLFDRSLQCLEVNEAMGRTSPSSIFPWTNAYINGVESVRSPFPLVAGSPVYKVLLSGSCTLATLQGSDADGDALTFYPLINDTVESLRSSGTRGEVLEFCDNQNVGRRQVTIDFNVCDTFNSCSSPHGSGLGRAIFQMLPPGPAVISFQALPRSGKLRLVFNTATNTPAVDNEEQVASLIALDPPQRLLFGAWEAGGEILQLVMSDPGWLARGGALPELKISILETGGLRDAGLENYPSMGTFSGLVDQTCTNGTVLVDGLADCVPCQPGEVPVVEGSEDVCQQCGLGEFADSSTRCELCAPGTWSNVTGASACMPCMDGKTTPRGARTVDECRCPAGTYDMATLVDGNVTNLFCRSCGNGLTCPGQGEVYLLEGYSATDPAEVFRCHQDIKRCPGGAIGTCAPGREGVSCSLCIQGMIPNDDGSCQDCTDGDLVPTIVLVLVILVLLACLYVRIDRENASKDSRSLILIGIACQQLLTAFQMFSVTSQIRVDWHEPVKTIFRLMQLLVVDVDLINVNCVGSFTPLSKYISRLLFVGAALLVIGLFHLISVLAFHRGQFRKRMASLLGVIGSVFMMFYISILGTILLSMQCDEHPSGKWTVNAYPTIVCWEGGDHVPMVMVALIALVIPVSFLAKCSQVVWIAPQRIQKMDLDFLQTYSFLFKRFRAETRWFAIVFLLRSALIAMMPIITIVTWKIMILQTVMIASIVITAYFRPWCAAPAEFLDISSAAVVMIILTLVAFQSDDSQNPELMATVATLSMVAVLVGIATFVLISAYSWIAQFRKRYQFFICHHKAHAGAVARLLKMVLVESPRIGRKVFLDADDLVHLDTLFDFVRHHTEQLLVLCSAEILLRPWCVGEITTAHINNVTTLPVIFSEFKHPEDAWLSQVARRVNLEALVQFGISEDLVQRAIKGMQSVEHLDMPPLLTQGAVMLLQTQIIRGCALPTDSPETTIGQHHAKVLMGADAYELDALAAARVLSKLLVAMCSHTPELTPVLMIDLQQHMDVGQLPSEAKNYVMLCTAGCFESMAFLEDLNVVVHYSLDTVPVVASEGFRFPTPSFYEDLHQSLRDSPKLASAKVPPAAVTEYVSRIFKRIAVHYSANSSLALMQAQAAEVLKQIMHSLGLAHSELGRSMTAAFGIERGSAPSAHDMGVTPSGKLLSSGTSNKFPVPEAEEDIVFDTLMEI